MKVSNLMSKRSNKLVHSPQVCIKTGHIGSTILYIQTPLMIYPNKTMFCFICSTCCCLFTPWSHRRSASWSRCCNFGNFSVIANLFIDRTILAVLELCRLVSTNYQLLETGVGHETSHKSRKYDQECSELARNYPRPILLHFFFKTSCLFFWLRVFSSLVENKLWLERLVWTMWNTATGIPFENNQ